CKVTGYNYFNFRQIFLELNNGIYSPLSDGNYFRFKAWIEDPSKTLQTIYQPVLTDKCQVRSEDDFWGNTFNMNLFLEACASGQYTDLIVATPDNNNHEVQIWINADEATANPTQFSFGCSQPNKDNLYENALEQPLLCSINYLYSEKPIDKFSFYLTNKNSDLAELEPENQQFIKLDIPYEVIYFNDMDLMRKALKKEFQTDTVDNIGEVFESAIDNLLGAFATPFSVLADGLSALGWIGSVNTDFGTAVSGNDLNYSYSTPVSPNNVSGMIFIKVSNINVVNKKDYEIIYPNASTISAKRFVEWANFENINLRNEKIRIDVYTNDMVKIMSKEFDNILVIDEDPPANNINQNVADANQGKFVSVPTIIKFEIISDMIYNNETSYNRQYVSIPYTVNLERENLCGLFGVACWFNDESGSVSAVVTNGDLSYFALNWFAILMVAISILFISVVAGNLKGKGTTINLPFRKGA
ncbi:MAG: hypothetical protein KAU95_02865, partial [Candidatus Aenigmarchaeota archaeon]|nr:hypothetical protein [Candidatus Aenigmarchaeota archaeon]